MLCWCRYCKQVCYLTDSLAYKIHKKIVTGGPVGPWDPTSPSFPGVPLSPGGPEIPFSPSFPGSP